MKILNSLFLLFATLAAPLIGKGSPTLTQKEQTYIQHVISCIEKAENFQSKITEDILLLPGMSGKKGRHFLNNLCSMPDIYYLEIGTYKGSTLVSALYGNQMTVAQAIAVDNWSQFGGPSDEFLTNIQRFIPYPQLTFIDADSFSVPIAETFSHPINIYFYDGHHGSNEQTWAFTYYNSILDDLFIAIVDDWNWGHVRDSTFTAFAHLPYEILFQREIFTGGNGDPEGWWNGMYVAVIRKKT